MSKDISKQDKAAGLTINQMGRKAIPDFSPDVLLDVLEQVAEGKLLRDIEMIPGMPRKRTIMQWVITFPEARQAYRAARELSAESFEEEAIGMGRSISKESSPAGAKVRAFEVAMNQLRWSAARRDPAKYGDQRQQTIVVPVQINTSLPMGGGTIGAGTEEHPNIYKLEAKVDVPIEGNFTELPPQEEKGLVKTSAEKAKKNKGWPGPHKRVLTPRVPKEVQKNGN